MPTRVNLGKAAPELYKTVVQLDKLASDAVKSAGISEGLSHLIRLRASQINGCAFCARMHTRDAIASGESTDRLSVLPAWRDTSYFNEKERSAYFNEKERSALALVESITTISDGQIPDVTYEHAHTKLTEEEISAIEWLCIVINTWNRIAIASRYTVGE